MNFRKMRVIYVYFNKIHFDFSIYNWFCLHYSACVFGVLGRGVGVLEQCPWEEPRTSRVPGTLRFYFNT